MSGPMVLGRSFLAGLVTTGALAGSLPAGLPAAHASTLHASQASHVSRPAALPAIGDPRDPSQPTLPAVTCATVTAQLPGGTRVFPAADEADPPDTARIQAALDSCQGTDEAVRLAPGPGRSGDTAFLSDPLTVHADEILVLGSGVTLFATRDAAAYQEAGKAVCGSIGTDSTGCNPFIKVNGQNSGVEGVLTRSRADGHRITRWATIDGRGDMTILGTDTTWYQVAATATAEGLKQVNPRLIQTSSANNVTFYHIQLVDSAKQHLFISDSDGATVWGIQIHTPDDTLNTDGVDVDSSTDVTVTDSDLMEGDDCVALTTNNAAESNVTVSRLHCYGTHGLSIGSGTTFGLNSILFIHNTVNGRDDRGVLSSLDNGIRIKSFEGGGGTLTNVVYADTCMTAVQDLLVINPFYDPPSGTTIPYFKSITVDRALAVHSVAPASSMIEGFSPAVPTGLTLKDVNFDVTTVTAQDSAITLDRTDLDPAGPDVTVTTAPGGSRRPAPMHCTFPPFPHFSE